MTPQIRTRLDNDMKSARELADSLYTRIQELPRDNMTVKLSNDFSKELSRFEVIVKKLGKSSGNSNSNSNDLARDNRPPVYGSTGTNGDYSLDMSGADPYETSIGQGETETHQLLDQEAMGKLDLEERRRRQADILQVEQDVHDLHDMFQEMQNIVQEQGEKLDTIDNNIAVIHEQMDQAHDEIVEAEEYQNKARKKKCMLILILVTVIAVIILIFAKTMF